MSEPKSFFARIRINEEQFKSFCFAKPKEPQLDENWIHWWNTRIERMYVKPELRPEKLRCYLSETNEQIVNELQISKYDAINKWWHFGVVMLTENLFDMLPMLAFVKSVAPFAIEDDGNFAIVYDFCWGDADISAFITFKNGEGIFNCHIDDTAKLPKEMHNYANACLNEELKKMTFG